MLKLNPDCIRDILLTVEENTDFSTGMSYPDEYDRLCSYSENEVFYHINQCELSHFFTDVSWFIGSSCIIHDLSPQGHEFIANIRLDTNWNKTKDIAKNVGSYSLNTLTKIATSVISSIISP